MFYAFFNFQTSCNVKAETKGIKPGTKDYNNYVKKYVESRNITLTVMEYDIKNGNRTKGKAAGTWVCETQDVKVIVNYSGDVVTVMPK